MSTMISNPGSAVALTDSPLPPEQIIEGSLEPHIWISAQTADKKVTHGVWDCGACRFTWDYEWDEFVMVLEGEVTITTGDGATHRLKAGDFAHFRPGLKTTWQVDNYVKKTFTLRTADPLEF